MSMSDNEETESQLAILCHQMKLPAPGLGYIQLSCWPKGFHGNPQTTQAVAKTVDTGLFFNCWWDASNLQCVKSNLESWYNAWCLSPSTLFNPLPTSALLIMDWAICHILSLYACETNSYEGSSFLAVLLMFPINKVLFCEDLGRHRITQVIGLTGESFRIPG